MQKLNTVLFTYLHNKTLFVSLTQEEWTNNVQMRPWLRFTWESPVAHKFEGTFL